MAARSNRTAPQRTAEDGVTRIELLAVVLHASAVNDTHSGGGWAVVVHGQLGGGQRFMGGHTVQFDRGYAGGEFILREWVPNGNGGVTERSPVVRVPAPGFDWHAAHDVRVEVDGPEVRLILNGSELLRYDQMNLSEGALGVRTWGGTNLGVDASRVTVGS